MDKQKVFISHSALDNGWSRQFASSLERRGLRVLFASSAVHSGQTLVEAMEYGLRNSNVIALLVTPDTIRRPNLFFELGAALGMGKPLIPVVSEDVDPAALPASLRSRGYLLKKSPQVTAQEFAAQAQEYEGQNHSHPRTSRIH
jgi:predicted nucleotide-binding protein